MILATGVPEDTIKNQGSDATDVTTWYDTVYLSQDNIFDLTDTFIGRLSAVQIPLAIQGEYTVDATITLPKTATGKQFLLFVTDEKYNQLEANEGNNVLAKPIEFLNLNNNPPTDVQLTNNKVDENISNGVIVGVLTTIDADAGDSHTYKLLDNAGGRFS
jgi:hypothetical protein